MKIYATGDIHGNISQLMNAVQKVKEQAAGREALLLIPGDFGFFSTREEAIQRLEAVSTSGVIVAYVDGNHDSFNLLDTLPKTRWKNGNVHVLAPNVYHLIRGEVFQLDKRRLFAFGGAASRDRVRRLRIERETGIKTWFSEEVPSKEELERGLSHLRQCGYRVDIVLTHTAPHSLLKIMGYLPLPAEDELTRFFDQIRDMTFDKWVFGHLHTESDLARFSCLHERLIEL